MNRRHAILGFCASALLSDLLRSGRAMAGDKLTEKTMTKADYNRITETESSEAGKPAAERPDPVHDLSPFKRKAVEDAHGVRVITGKEWNKESPKERDAHLRRIYETAPKDSSLVITVPTGDVWLIPDGETYDDLVDDAILREWKSADIAALPVSVAPDPLITQSDRHGSDRPRARRDEED